MSVIESITDTVFSDMETDLMLACILLIKEWEYLLDMISPPLRGSGPPISNVNDHPVHAASAVKICRNTAGHSLIAL